MFRRNVCMRCLYIMYTLGHYQLKESHLLFLVCQVYLFSKLYILSNASLYLLRISLRVYLLICCVTDDNYRFYDFELCLNSQDSYSFETVWVFNILLNSISSSATRFRSGQKILIDTSPKKIKNVQRAHGRVPSVTREMQVTAMSPDFTPMTLRVIKHRE